MIDKTRRFPAHEKKINAEIHFRKHLHLTASLYLKHPQLHMQSASNMRVDHSSEPSTSTRACLMKELSTLQKSPSLRDPSMSPSCKFLSIGSLLRKVDRETKEEAFTCQQARVAGDVDSETLKRIARIVNQLNGNIGTVEEGPLKPKVDNEISFNTGGQEMICTRTKRRKGTTSSREDGVEGGSFESERDVLPFSDTTSQSKQRSRGDIGAAQRKRRIKRKRMTYLKLSSMRINKGVLNTGLIAGSQSLQSLKSSPTAHRVVASSSTNEYENFDDSGQNGCTSPWNCSRIHSKDKVVARAPVFQKSGQIELGLAEKNLSSPVVIPEGLKPIKTLDISEIPCSNDSKNLLLLEPATLSDNSSTGEHRVLKEGGVCSEKPPNRGIQSSKKRVLLPCKNMQSSSSLKYAPKFFQDIVGQHLVIQALSNALSRGRIAPMYIFYGPRGTGKTSCAKLFALALNCLSLRIDRPCGSCRLCLAQISGKVSTVKEVNAGSICGVKGIRLLMKDIAWSSSSLYTVCLMDECQSLSSKAWNAFLEGVEAASRKAVFILTTVTLEQLPHAVVSRCQKFLFYKIKEKDIIDRLQMIASQESLGVDIEALKLIASACNGSLRDAEMMLDHISLLGEKVSVPIVQELVGLISELSLVELLDFALSANIVNTVQSLRVLFESGVEPLDLMSQLASLITRILAGGYQPPKKTHTSKFFRRKDLTKEDMQRLRQALRTLSEAEKQVRGSSDRMTWLTAALLQFAPDGSYVATSCSADTSPVHSPIGRNISNTNETPKISKKQDKIKQQHARYTEPGPISPTKGIIMNVSEPSKRSDLNLSHQPLQSSQSSKRNQWSRTFKEDMPYSKAATFTTQLDNNGDEHIRKHLSIDAADLEEVWQRVLDAVHSNSLKCFLQNQGKLVSLSFCGDFGLALLEFHQLEHTSRAQRSRASITHAFQSTLGYRVEVKVHLASCVVEACVEEQLTRQANSGDQVANLGMLQQADLMSGSGKTYSNQIVIEASSRHGQDDVKATGMHQTCKPHKVYGTVPTHIIKSQKNGANERVQIVSVETRRAGGVSTICKNMLCDDKHRHARSKESTHYDFMDSSYKVDKNSRNGCIQSDNGVSLGYVVQQAEGSVEGYSQDLQFDHLNAALSQKLVGLKDLDPVYIAAQEEGRSTMADKLEEENLRVELASGGLLCWKTTHNGRKTVECFQPCSRRSRFLLGLFPCAKYQPSL